MVLLTIVFYSFLLIRVSSNVTLEVDPAMARDRPSFITCITSNQITRGVYFFNDAAIQGGCFGPGVACDSTVLGYSVTQNVTARTTTLIIDSVNCTREIGSWYCAHGADPPSTGVYIGCNTTKYAPSIDKSRFPSTFFAVKGRQLSMNCASYTTPGRPSSTSYTWTRPDGSSTSGSTLQVNSVDTSDAGQYTCRVSNNFSSAQQGQDSAALRLIVQFAPNILGQDPSYPVRELSPLNIDCRTYTTAGNPSSTSYRWTGPNSLSSSQPILSIRSISRNQTGIYTCKASNTFTPTGGSTESGIGEGEFSVDVQFLDRPVLTTDQSEVRENESVSLKFSTLSHPIALLTVRNVDNDTVVVKQQTNELTYIIDRVQCLHNGSFVCSAENEATGLSYSPMMPLNVLCSPRLDKRKPLKTNVSSGLDEIASLLLNVISNPAPSFRWYLSDNQQLVPIPNITKHEVISTAKCSVLQIHVKNVRDYASYVVETTSNHVSFRITFSLLPTSSSPQETPADRLGVGIVIGIAAVLPIIAIGICVYVCLKRRNQPLTKGCEATNETQIDMASMHPNDNRSTYSELTRTPGNEYEELKVQRTEGNRNPCDGSTGAIQLPWCTWAIAIKKLNIGDQEHKERLLELHLVAVWQLCCNDHSHPRPVPHIVVSIVL